MSDMRLPKCPAVFVLLGAISLSKSSRSAGESKGRMSGIRLVHSPAPQAVSGGSGTEGMNSTKTHPFDGWIRSSRHARAMRGIQDLVDNAVGSLKTLTENFDCAADDGADSGDDLVSALDELDDSDTEDTNGGEAPSVAARNRRHALWRSANERGVWLKAVKAAQSSQCGSSSAYLAAVLHDRWVSQTSGCVLTRLFLIIHNRYCSRY